MMLTSKEKLPQPPHPFGPQRDLCYGITSGCFWAVVFFEKSDPIFFLFFVWVRINHVNVSLQGKRYYRYYCRSRGQGTSWSRKLSSLLSRVHLFCKFIDLFPAELPFAETRKHNIICFQNSIYHI